MPFFPCFLVVSAFCLSCLVCLERKLFTLSFWNFNSWIAVVRQGRFTVALDAFAVFLPSGSLFFLACFLSFLASFFCCFLFSLAISFSAFFSSFFAFLAPFLGLFFPGFLLFFLPLPPLPAFLGFLFPLLLFFLFLSPFFVFLPFILVGFVFILSFTLFVVPGFL